MAEKPNDHNDETLSPTPRPKQGEQSRKQDRTAAMKGQTQPPPIPATPPPVLIPAPISQPKLPDTVSKQKYPETHKELTQMPTGDDDPPQPEGSHQNQPARKATARQLTSAPAKSQAAAIPKGDDGSGFASNVVQVAVAAALVLLAVISLVLSLQLWRVVDDSARVKALKDELAQLKARQGDPVQASATLAGNLVGSGASGPFGSLAVLGSATTARPSSDDKALADIRRATESLNQAAMGSDAKLKAVQDKLNQMSAASDSKLKAVQDKLDQVGTKQGGQATPTDVLLVAMHSTNLSLHNHIDSIYEFVRPDKRQPGCRVGLLLMQGGEAEPLFPIGEMNAADRKAAETRLRACE